MPFLDKLASLIKDPPPDYVFEISEAGIAFVRPGPSRQVGFEPLENDVISVSPLRDNILRPEVLGAKIQQLASATTNRKRRAVLILPDYCARVAVLEFDSFPAKAEEQSSLVRFRMKKSVPFDVESAALSYYPQVRADKKLDVVVAVAALEIVARYEAPFRAAGLQTGIVTTSALAAVDLEKGHGISLMAKLSGRVLTLSVFRAGILKLVRCIELPQVTEEEIMGAIFPTVAFIEDEMAAKPDRIALCGFDSNFGSRANLLEIWEDDLGVKMEPLHSRMGTPGPFNAGLYGYLESAQLRAA
jgi:type IV pilus assembly protein PilM